MPFSQHVASTPPAEGHFLQPFGRERPFPRSFSIALPPLEKEAATRLEKKEEGEEREREKKRKGKTIIPFVCGEEDKPTRCHEPPRDKGKNRI